MGLSIAVIIPTYNEFDLLERCIQSLENQTKVDLNLIVVNAGEPLPNLLAHKVEEHKVPSDYFWGRCIAHGFDLVRKGNYQYVMLANADTEFFPNSVQLLVDEARKSDNVIACSPGYYYNEQGNAQLMYSHVIVDPLLIHFRKAPDKWIYPHEAPLSAFEIQLTGGQGVLFNRTLLDIFDVDYKSFPHYGGDYDLWMTMRKKGCILRVVPGAGVINLKRQLPRQKNLLKCIWNLIISDYSPMSYKMLWNLRRKHLPWPVYPVSTCVVYLICYVFHIRKHLLL